MNLHKKEAYFLMYFGILALTLNIVSATPYVYMTDDWSADEGTTTDEAIFVDYEIFPDTLGITDMDADFICYDWDDDGTYDNCYYDSDGCGGGGCTTESCNYYSIPNNMNDYWKASCNIDGGSGACRIGEDVPSRICGTCDGVDTSTEQRTYIDTIIYYDCDDSQSNRHYADLANDDFFVVSPKKYDCDDCAGCYNYNTYDFEGDFASSGESWADIKIDISCAANKKCSEYFDDDLVYTATGSIDIPCKWDDGQSCTLDSDCASNECVHYVCRPTDPYCGDEYCDSGETTSNCPDDCCRGDCTGKATEGESDEICHSSCDTYNSCEFYSSSTKTVCDGNSYNAYQCVDADTRVYCCIGNSVDCSSNQYCSGGSCLSCSTVCDDSCQSSACYGTDPDCDENGDPTLECGNETDMEIIDVIPIQVIPDVDMVKGKSGYVRVIVKNNGPLGATAVVNMTFDGSPLAPYNPANAERSITSGNNATFDFHFKPMEAGNNKKIVANVTIVS